MNGLCSGAHTKKSRSMEMGKDGALTWQKMVAGKRWTDLKV